MQMFTVVECRAKAKEKIALAALNPRRRRSLMAAAKGWDFLADQIEGADAASLRIQAIATDT